MVQVSRLCLEANTGQIKGKLDLDSWVVWVSKHSHVICIGNGSLLVCWQEATFLCLSVKSVRVLCASSCNMTALLNNLGTGERKQHLFLHSASPNQLASQRSHEPEELFRSLRQGTLFKMSGCNKISVGGNCMRSPEHKSDLPVSLRSRAMEHERARQLPQNGHWKILQLTKI